MDKLNKIREINLLRNINKLNHQYNPILNIAQLNNAETLD